MPFAFELMIIVVMLLLNAVFAAYEMALASISRSRIQVLLNQKRHGAAAAAYMKDKMEASLAVVQLGITFVGAIAAATGGAGIEESLSPYLERVFGMRDPWSEIVALLCLIIPLSCFTIVFGELVPKVFALRNKEHVCLLLSPFMKGLSVVANPVVNLFEQTVKKVIYFGQKRLDLEVSEEQGLHELRAAASLARGSKLIGAREEKIVLAAAHLSVSPISSVMVPASEFIMIPARYTLDEALIKAHMDLHTRFPVSEKEDDPQTVIGYLNFKDVVLALKMNPSDPSIRGITRAIKSFESKLPISQVLGEMMHEKVHIALVSSAEKGIEGLITMEDIIEELVGDIEDEYDRMPTYMNPYGQNWIIGGGAPMQMIAARIGRDAASFGLSNPLMTLNDWCALKLGKEVQGADLIQADGLRVLVRKLRRRKVSEAIVAVEDPGGGSLKTSG